MSEHEQHTGTESYGAVALCSFFQHLSHFEKEKVDISYRPWPGLGL
jgi:hypothetical protein